MTVSLIQYRHFGSLSSHLPPLPLDSPSSLLVDLYFDDSCQVPPVYLSPRFLSSGLLSRYPTSDAYVLLYLRPRLSSVFDPGRIFSIY